MSKNRLFHGRPTARLIVTVAADTVAAMDAALRDGHPAHGNRAELVRQAIEAELARWREADDLSTPSRARETLQPDLADQGPIATQYAHANDSGTGAAEKMIGGHYARANDLAPWLEKRLAAMPPPRVRCGARRRRDGKPCQALSVPGKRRCKWHGGCSTGPRTAEGKAKVARNLPRRGSDK